MSLADERFCFHGPPKGLGHGCVEVSDELVDLGAQGFFAGEISTTKELSHQDGEPNLDLVEPRCVFGREVEGDAMLGRALERFSGRLGCEHAGLSFYPKLDLEAAGAGNEPNHGF